MKPVLTDYAVTHAIVALTQNVPSQITGQFVLVFQDMMVILTTDVGLVCTIFFLINVYILNKITFKISNTIILFLQLVAELILNVDLVKHV